MNARYAELKSRAAALFATVPDYTIEISRQDRISLTVFACFMEGAGDSVTIYTIFTAAFLMASINLSKIEPKDSLISVGEFWLDCHRRSLNVQKCCELVADS